MKKALALVLALVLALSMAVSAFALELVVLDKDPVAPNGPKPVVLSDAWDEAVVNYTTTAGTYYIALEDVPYTDVKVSATGAVTAELVKFDPDTMVLVDASYNPVPVYFAVTYKGAIYEEGLDYATALANAAKYNNEEKVTYYGVVMTSNVNVIKVTCEENYSVAYTEGYVKVTAKLGTDTYSGTLHFVNDVIIYEYEEVKWAAANYAAGAALDMRDTAGGYSDYETAVYGGYGWVYDEDVLRSWEEVGVISTTAFRAIQGKTIALVCPEDGVAVTVKNVAAGQKGVNFKHEVSVDLDENEWLVESINLDFHGNQVINSEFTVELVTGETWYTLRECFGVKVEEDDIVTYYLLKDGKVVKEYVVDYMTADINELVEISYTGSNETLGHYQIVIEVPANEVAGEENPNTGAEAVVGVVAALAVVSVATAAAVSLKK